MILSKPTLSYFGFVLLYFACVSPGSTVSAATSGQANGTCLMALEANSTVNKARHYPGSTADFTEIISAKAIDGAIKVKWKTSVFMPNGSTKTVLRGTCTTTANGSTVKSITFGK
jgi:hypothetical protein